MGQSVSINFGGEAQNTLAVLDFTELAPNTVFTQPDLAALSIDGTAGNSPFVSNWAPGFNEGRVSIIAAADLPAQVPGGGNAMRIRSPQGSYGVQNCGASYFVELVPATVDRNPAEDVVNEGIYTAGYDELWVENLVFYQSNFDWNGVSSSGWKQPGGFLIGPPKDTRWESLGSPTTGSGSETADEGRNTGGHPGTGEWYSGGSTRIMSRWEQPAGLVAEYGGAITTYAYHADQQSPGGYGDHIYFCADSSGNLQPGSASAVGSERNPFSGGAAAGGEYLNIPEGRWVRIAQRCKLNTPGLFDGEVEAFIDGVSLGVQTGYRWRKSAAQNASGLDATWGIQGIAMYHFSGGATSAYAVDRSDLWVARVTCADYDFVTAG